MWLYQGKEFTDPDSKLIGFVYLITCNVSGKRYIGKKLFWSTKRKQVKGKSKRIKVESDWKSYWSSSDELKSDVKKLGEENFTKEIIHLCFGKGELSYLEAREQFDRRVLESATDWYNSWIMVRVNASHLKTLRK